MIKTFQGRIVVCGEANAKAVVSRQGFNTLASFQKSLLAKKTDAVCSDQNNPDLFNKPMAHMALCLPQSIGSTTGGLVFLTASAMGAAPACLLFSEPIDSLAAAGAILSDVWTQTSMPTIDTLGKDFLDFVKDGMQVTVAMDGTVTVSD